MTNVKYTGPSDFQGFGPDDFRKQGVATEEWYHFPRGRVIEVPEEIADLLTIDGGVGVFNGFSFEVTDEPAWEEPKPPAVKPEPEPEEPEVQDLSNGEPMGVMVDPGDPPVEGNSDGDPEQLALDDLDNGDITPDAETPSTKKKKQS